MSDPSVLDGDLDGDIGDDLDGDDLDGDDLDGDDLGDDMGDDNGDDMGNRLVGGLSRSVLEYLAKAIVDDPESVVIEADEGRSGLTLRLHVAPSDMGRIIGRRGRVAQAIRTVVRAAAAREGVEANVDIAD